RSGLCSILCSRAFHSGTHESTPERGSARNLPKSEAAPAGHRLARELDMRTRTLWITLVLVLLGSFAVLLRQGRAIDRQQPPIPGRVVDPAGRVVFTGDDIRRGQEVWQRLGGQQLGSVWGHGAYLAPDWSSDWLHREAELILDDWACAEGATSYAAASPERAAALRARLHAAMRSGSYDR